MHAPSPSHHFPLGSTIAGFWQLATCVALLGTPSLQQASRAEPAVEAVPVVVAEASRMELSRGQPFVGTVYPFRESDVGSAKRRDVFLGLARALNQSSISVRVLGASGAE